MARAFLVAWAGTGLRWALSGWQFDGWYVLFFLVHGAHLAVRTKRDRVRRRVVDGRLARIDAADAVG
jgi:hypothetical protein